LLLRWRGTNGRVVFEVLLLLPLLLLGRWRCGTVRLRLLWRW
jgi:hypothetical protein